MPKLLNKSNWKSFYSGKVLSVMKKTRPLLAVQAVVGAVIAWKQHDVSELLARKVTREEYQQTVHQSLNDLRSGFN